MMMVKMSLATNKNVEKDFYHVVPMHSCFNTIKHSSIFCIVYYIHPYYIKYLQKPTFLYELKVLKAKTNFEKFP